MFRGPSFPLRVHSRGGDRIRHLFTWGRDPQVTFLKLMAPNLGVPPSPLVEGPTHRPDGSSSPPPDARLLPQRARHS